MGVVFTVGDDTNDLLVPFIQKYNPDISREKVNEFYLSASLGQISSCQFWQEVGLKQQYPQIETLYLDTQLTLDKDFIPVAQNMVNKYSLGLLSNDVNEWSHYLRNKFKLDFFSLNVISGDVQCRKPDFGIYEHFLKNSDTNAEDCIFVDDRCKNLRSANLLGMHTVQFMRQKEKNGFIPSASITSFNELESVIASIDK